MGGEDRRQEITSLCNSLSSLTGRPVDPLSPISDLGVNSLEMLQLVVAIGNPRLIDAFPAFFKPNATPASVWDAAYETR
ncbi:hypothetical protein CHUV2995_02885 [Corynebacterium diphtheriae subsp. lausannense]|uniref:acyl carrier protein n=1 Tax=Corynebacterium belfantii TaxID=2014537 RepID=UPI00095EFE35|nr:acyl carrier protein [Corynebacterium belfantii]OLN14550.1 hypothetical protein BUE64_12475 [Corynebacterium diphtheriae subsp. lausannense]MBG9311403.1 acyl carrier protein [Corynebacterium belfantii]MBG9320457.1 acyl carrier protein [Corynebacterium belfantii]MBG9325504.1 acyl carrier protein [Corynebacterium belfantii]